MILVVPVLQPRHHGLDRDHCVVDQQAQSDDECAQRDSLKVDPEQLHRHEHNGEDERNRERHDRTGTCAEAEQAHPKNNGDGLPQSFHEFIDRVLDRYWLIGHECRFDADGQVGHDLGHRVLDIASQGQNVAAFAHGDGDPDPIASVDAEHGLRRISGTACHARNVTEANCLAVCHEVDREDVRHGAKRTRHPHEDLLIAGLHDAGGDNRVLSLQRADQCGAVDAEARQLLSRKLHVQALVLRSEDIDLGNVRQREELFADVVHVVPQLPMREPIGGEPVDDPVGIAEFVVEARPNNALRQRVANIADLLANLIPDVRDLCGGSSSSFR